MKPLTPARFAAAEWLESKINAWDAAATDTPDLSALADMPPLPGDVSIAAFLDALREMVAGAVVAPKPTPTLDLPPAPEGLTWGRAYLSPVFHLVRHNGSSGLLPAVTRRCNGGRIHDLRKKINPKSRACPACLAIARGQS